jgi:hypothetical protein
VTLKSEIYVRLIVLFQSDDEESEGEINLHWSACLMTLALPFSTSTAATSSTLLQPAPRELAETTNHNWQIVNSKEHETFIGICRSTECKTLTGN